MLEAITVYQDWLLLVIWNHKIAFKLLLSYGNTWNHRNVFKQMIIISVQSICECDFHLTELAAIEFEY